MMMTATYSPDDNKLRLYSLTRLPKDLYLRVSAAGFKWAPKQGLFVTPMWTPEREDLLLELCGEIDDEDTSLVERAEERAERFAGYKEKRAADAERARDAVEQITSGIPFGQPILVGHHSERRARRDASRIENGMRKSVRMWDTAQYWKSRAAGALRHAKYKERPDVRHRRIARLEAELRRVQHQYTPDPKTQAQVWDGETHVWCGQGRSGHWVKESALDSIKVRSVRWEAHYRNRIEYERAMLGEAGGLPADTFDIQKGGRVLVSGEWVVVLKVNKSGDKVVSVTTNARYVRVKGIEEIVDYQPPTSEDIERTKKATKLAPLVNYRSDGCFEITKAEWKRWEQSQSGYAKKMPATVNHGAHRQRIVYRGGRLVCVFLTDSKIVDKPLPSQEAPVALPRERIEPDYRAKCETPPVTSFDVMREQLRNGGVQVVSVPQLIPSPPELAERIADLAQIKPGQRVLDPNAGTGRLLKAARSRGAIITAVEINYQLVQQLRRDFDDVHHADFLKCNGDLGMFDAVLINPPFKDAEDIEHIKHAMNFVVPGGHLSGVCANGSRQARELRPLIEARGGTWEELPARAFASEGVNVHTALFHVQL